MKCPSVMPTILLLVLLFTCILTLGAASANPHAQIVEHLLALHDPADVTNALPEIATLWPDQSHAYTQCVTHILNILTAAPANEVVVQASRRMFANVATNSIPWDHEDSSSLLRLRCQLTHQCLNVPLIRTDISTWLVIASTLGQVRSRIVPNYMKQGQLNPPNLMHASSQEEAQRARAENQKKIATDRLQLELRVADRELKLLLLTSMKEASSSLNKPQRGQFIARIKSLARLNEEEARQLE